MPVLPSTGSPYTPISKIVQMARVRANDAGLSIDGELLSNDQPYLEAMVNSAWKWLQGRAATAGIETYIKETLISGVSPALTWGDQCFINWQGSGCSDFESDYPALPADLIMPLTVWFQSTSGLYFQARQAANGLCVVPTWEEYDWRQDGMWFYGYQNAAMNMRIRYTAAFQDLVIAQDTPLPMLYAEDVMAWRIVGEFANARGGAQSGAVFQMADDAFTTFSQRTSRKNQRRTLRRQPYGGCSYGVF